MTRLKASTTAQSLRQRNTQALTRHTEQKSIFRTMYLQMAPLKKVLSVDLQKNWMEQKKYVYMRSYRRDLQFQHL